MEEKRVIDKYDNEILITIIFNSEFKQRCEVTKETQKIAIIFSSHEKRLRCHKNPYLLISSDE